MKISFINQVLPLVQVLMNLEKKTNKKVMQSLSWEDLLKINKILIMEFQDQANIILKDSDQSLALKSFLINKNL